MSIQQEGIPTDARVEYRLEGAEVIREDKDGKITVAKYDAKGGVVRLLREHSRYRRQVIQCLNEEGASIKDTIYDDAEVDMPKANIPPMPKKNPRLGDKTPAVVEWLRKYKPSEYEARYGIKGPGVVRKMRYKKDDNGDFVRDRDGSKIAEYYEQDAILAERKTHLTEKIEGNDAGSSEYDWDADKPKAD